MHSILKRFTNMLLTLFGVVTTVFFLFNVLPGDPAQMMLDQNEDSKKIEIVKKKYGFDKPVFVQYLYYLNDLSPFSIHFKETRNISNLNSKKYTYFKLFSLKMADIVIKMPYLIESYQKKGVKVSDVILNTLPNTIVLAVASISIAIFLGLFFGIFSALYKPNLFLHKFGRRFQKFTSQLLKMDGTPTSGHVFVFSFVLYTKLWVH